MGRDTKSYQKLRERRKAKGLCVVCKKPNTRSTNRCKKCTDKAVAANRRAKEAIRASGACQTCGRSWKGKTKNCKECKAMARAKWAARSFTSDRCTRCAGPRDDGKKACSKCRAEQRASGHERRRRYESLGVCVQDGKEDAAPGTKYCRRHLLMNQATRWLGTSARWQEFEQLMQDQGGICPYTGKELNIGDNASIDHKTPRSRDGSDDLENLQWVSWRVNRSKTDMTHDEFIEFCRLVADRSR